MKFRTSTGSIIEPKSEEVAQQLQNAGYEVVEETSAKTTKTSKKSDSV